MSGLRVFVAAAAGLALSSAPASARQDDAAEAAEAAPDIAGNWMFEADLRQACSFGGQARLMPTDTPGTYDCELTARQHCPTIDTTYVVAQSCTVSVEGEDIMVRSRIETFLEGEPTAFYTPDSFQLRLDSPSLMSGLLLGADIYEAEWRRADGAIS